MAHLLFADNTMSGQTQLEELYALPIYNLPTELVLSIIERLPMRDYPALILGALHLLRQHGIAPTLSTPEFHTLMESKPAYAQNTSRITIKNLPPELRFLCTQYLSVKDKINFIMATWKTFNWALYVTPTEAICYAHVSAQCRAHHIIVGITTPKPSMKGGYGRVQHSTE